MLGDGGGVLLDPRGARALGRQALAVWRHLVDYRGYADRTMLVSYQRVAADTGVAYRTVERLMRRLVEAHLVAKRCTHVRRTDGFTSNVEVQVFGACGPGVDWVPKATLDWCRSRPLWGGVRPRKLRVMARIGGDSVAQDQGVSPPSCGLYESSNLTEESASFPTGKEDAPAGAAVLPGFIDQHSIPKRSLQLPKLTGDPDDPDKRTRALVRLGWMQCLVNAYNAAYRSAGTSSFLRLPGKEEVEFCSWDGGKAVEPTTRTGKTRAAHDPAIERWKHYQPLLEAGRALQAHNIAPEAWATWAVQRAKGRVIPPNRIFIAGHVNSNSHRHIFRQESGYGYGETSKALAPEQVHFEQMYRLREANAYRQGQQLNLMVFPPWYVKIRKDERAQGLADPMVRFPAVIKGGK